MQIGSITSDNASYLISAFELSDQTEATLFVESSRQIEVVCAEEQEDSTESKSPEDDDVLSSWSQSQPNEKEDPSEIEENLLYPEVILMSAAESNKRNPCLNHLLHLGIQSVCQANPTIQSITKQVNNIVKFFRHSTFYAQQLKSKAGLTMVKPCPTRWSSVYKSLERVITKTRDDVSILSF